MKSNKFKFALALNFICIYAFSTPSQYIFEPHSNILDKGINPDSGKSILSYGTCFEISKAGSRKIVDEIKCKTGKLTKTWGSVSFKKGCVHKSQDTGWLELVDPSECRPMETILTFVKHESPYYYRNRDGKSTLKFGNCYEVDLDTKGSKYKVLRENANDCRVGKMAYTWDNISSTCYEKSENGWIKNTNKVNCRPSTKFIFITNTNPIFIPAKSHYSLGYCHEVDKETSGKKYDVIVDTANCKPKNTNYEVVAIHSEQFCFETSDQNSASVVKKEIKKSKTVLSYLTQKFFKEDSVNKYHKTDKFMVPVKQENCLNSLHLAKSKTKKTDQEGSRSIASVPEAVE